MYETPNSQIFASQVDYVETSIRPGLTIDQYRRSRPRKPSRWQRMKELAGGAQPVHRLTPPFGARMIVWRTVWPRARHYTQGGCARGAPVSGRGCA